MVIPEQLLFLISNFVFVRGFKMTITTIPCRSNNSGTHCRPNFVVCLTVLVTLGEAHTKDGIVCAILVHSAQ